MSGETETEGYDRVTRGVTPALDVIDDGEHMRPCMIKGLFALSKSAFFQTCRASTKASVPPTSGVQSLVILDKLAGGERRRTRSV
jgi:hypothetical protein